jgi:hypothetical protein
LTFEPGSKLREIPGEAFADSPLLKSLFIPASVSVLDGFSFARSSIEMIAVDEANPNYCVSGTFLIGLEGTKLIRHFGFVENVVLDLESTIGSRLTQIDHFAFACEPILTSICIPASIEGIGQECFRWCSSLSQLTFESGSRLAVIGFAAFRGCSSIISICIPARVRVIPNFCFTECYSLAHLLFEADSQLFRIDHGAFNQCQSLCLLAIPARLEIMEFGAVRSCPSLTELRFDTPSRLKHLDLPGSDFGLLSIPDCVEVVCGTIGVSDHQSRALQFGRDSSLTELNLRDVTHHSILWTLAEPGNNVFVRLPEELLRKFRCKFERL